VIIGALRRQVLNIGCTLSSPLVAINFDRQLPFKVDQIETAKNVFVL